MLKSFIERPNMNPQWVQLAATAGKAEIANLPPELQPVVDAMFDKLLVHSDEIVDFGPQVFSLILTQLSLGNVNQAKLVYLATVASQQERDDALDQATDAAMKNKQASDAAWAKFEEIAVDILTSAAKAALPLLLTALMAAI